MRFFSFFLSLFLLSSMVFGNDSVKLAGDAFRMGNVKITALIDGISKMDNSILVSEDMLLLEEIFSEDGHRVLEKIKEEAIAENPDAEYAIRSVYLVEYKKRKILFDTGIGEEGLLLNSLEQINIDTDDITDILITHMHPDHIGGLLDEDNELMFPNATIYVPEEEANFWLAKGAEKSQKRVKGGADNAKKIFNYLEKNNANIVYFESGLDLSPHFDGMPIFSEAAFGHTPGHTIYRIADGGVEFVMWGDLVNMMDVQLLYPSVSSIYDMNKHTASKTRKRVLEYCNKKNAIVGGAHSILPSIFYITKYHHGYKKESIKRHKDIHKK